MCTTLSSITQTARQERNQDPVIQHKPAGQNNNPSHSVDLLQCKRSDCFCLCLSHALSVVGGESQTVWAPSSQAAAQSWTMKLSVALFFAGLFGALAAVFVLLSFGTDYWLLAAESCHSNSNGSVGPGGVTIQPGDVVMQEGAGDVTLYHEGFFWRCSFGGNMGDDNLLWNLWFINQPHSKVCMHAYLFPFPVSHQTHNATEYDSAIIYRGFWSIFMLIGVAAVVLGGFFIICAAPFASHRLYKAGGGLFLASGVFLLCVVVMYVLWVQVLDVVNVYIEHQRSAVCPNFQLSLNYGLSFMFAPVGIFFCLLAGLLFLLIGRTIQIHYN